jgi:preprotein translocase subunit SecA
MEAAFRAQVKELINSISVSAAQAAATVPEKETAVNFVASHEEALGIEGEKSKNDAAASDPATPKAGRNDPCPCGSGKKYKHCHGK